MARPLRRSPALVAGPVGRSVARPVARASVAPSGDLVQSVNDDAYPGVLAPVSDGRRVVVNGKGGRFQVQSLFDERGRPVWVGSSWFATKSALLAKSPDDLALAAAVVALPECPAGLASEFVAVRQAQASAFRRSDYRRDDYPGVVGQVEDWRLVVEPDGQTYRLLFVPIGHYFGGLSGGNMWASSMFSPDLDVIFARLEKASPDRFGSSSEFWYSPPYKILPALVGLPRQAADGDWPDLVARPVSVRRQHAARRGR